MLKSHILKILAGGPDKGILEVSLRHECSVRQDKQVGNFEWKDAMSDLKRGKFISTETDALLGDDRVKITAAGIALLK